MASIPITRPTLLLGTDFNFNSFDFQNGVTFKANNSHAVEKLKQFLADTELITFLRDQSITDDFLNEMKLIIQSPDTHTLRIQIQYQDYQQKVYAPLETIRLICHYIFPPTKGGQDQVARLHVWRHLVEMGGSPIRHSTHKTHYLELTRASSEIQRHALESNVSFATDDSLSTIRDGYMKPLELAYRINPAYSLWVEEEEVTMPKRLALAENILDSHLPVKALIDMIRSYCSNDPPPPRLWRDRNLAITDHTSSNSSSSSSSTTISQS